MAPMAGVPRLLQQIANKLGRDYGASIEPETCITVTDGATEGLFEDTGSLFEVTAGVPEDTDHR